MFEDVQRRHKLNSLLRDYFSGAKQQAEHEPDSYMLFVDDN
jgi:hypothetical protein